MITKKLFGHIKVRSDQRDEADALNEEYEYYLVENDKKPIDADRLSLKENE